MQLSLLSPLKSGAIREPSTPLLPSKFCHGRMDSNPNSGNGFCRFPKRVPESLTVSRNHGRLIGIRCDGVVEKDDGFYMRRCVELARKAVGYTSPNPMVGCVIVKGGEIVGEGFHPKAGLPHAEVFALKDAGILAENATAYVSLEPCNHYGRTPPCTEALIRANVKRVVVGMVDPNPIVASKGVERLRESGIDVTVGVEEMLCRKLNEAYIHRMLTGKPFVSLRYSLSFGGGVINQLGKGADEQGGYYSQLLQEYDGIVISSSSLNGCSTLPTSQETGANQPLKIIISRSGKSLLHLPTLTRESATRVILITERNTVAEPEMVTNLHQGIETVVFDQIKLNSILDYCSSQGICSLLVDLRGDLGEFSEFLEGGVEDELFQKVVMELCPVWDRSKEDSVLEMGGKSLRLKHMQSRICKESIIVEGYISFNQ